jgi:hypothetical protein
MIIDSRSSRRHLGKNIAVLVRGVNPFYPDNQVIRFSDQRLDLIHSKHAFSPTKLLHEVPESKVF